MTVSAIILAAGKSTRMKSQQIKVLHHICGRPMLAYVLDAVRQAGVRKIAVVVGHGRQEVMQTFDHQEDILWVHQEEQKGTGHAVKVCEAALAGTEGDVFVLAGDGPLIRPQTLERLMATHKQQNAALTLATSTLADPHGYGRIVRGEGQDVLGIVEEKDATDVQRQIKEVKPSYYLFNLENMFSALSEIKPNNHKGEYYLTDTVSIFRRHGLRVAAVNAVPPEDVLSINSRAELAMVNGLMQRRIVQTVMDSGVTIVRPDSTWIEFGAQIGQDTVLEPFTWIGSGAKVEAASHVPAGTVIGRGGHFG